MVMWGLVTRMKWETQESFATPEERKQTVTLEQKLGCKCSDSPLQFFCFVW